MKPRMNRNMTTYKFMSIKVMESKPGIEKSPLMAGVRGLSC
jgi:hypothetical protein